MSDKTASLKQPPKGSDARADDRADDRPDGTVPDSKRPANVSRDSSASQEPRNRPFKIWIILPGMKDATLLAGQYKLIIRANAFVVGKSSDEGRMAIVYAVTHTIEDLL